MSDGIVLKLVGLKDGQGRDRRNVAATAANFTLDMFGTTFRE